MREIRTAQSSIFETCGAQPIGLALKAMSAWLEPQVLDSVAAELRGPDVEDTGRRGLPVESVLRCAMWLAEYDHFKPLVLRVIDQTHRRVFQGKKVPADEKVFSLFEEHADIIVKGSRDIQYGHKLNLSTGRSGLIVDMVIEDGKPGDSEGFLPLPDRHIRHDGKPHRQMAADGGDASADNFEQATARGVKNAAFHKKRGLKIEETANSPLVCRRLGNFRAGIEGVFAA